jgi:hypothetical protein
MAIIYDFFEYGPSDRLIQNNKNAYRESRCNERVVESMMADKSVIPAHMLDELTRLRATPRRIPDLDQRSDSEVKVERSIKMIEHASGLMKIKSEQTVRLEQQLQALKQENGKLVAMCDQAHKAITDLKRQLDAQTARANAAEHYAVRLETQLNVTETAGRETKVNLARLAELIEQTFGPSANEFTIESDRDAAVA